MQVPSMRHLVTYNRDSADSAGSVPINTKFGWVAQSVPNRYEDKTSFTIMNKGEIEIIEQY